MLKKIRSLDLFTRTMDSSDPQEYKEIIKRINIPPTDFLPYSSWEKGTYTRNCIKRNEHYEMILLCWDKKAQTPIHGHDGQKCWVYQIEGDIIENRYGKLESNELVKLSNWKLRPSTLAFMNDKMGYHELINVSEGRSMTLHIYVNPIDECEVYDEDTKQFEQKSLCYDSRKNKPVKTN